MDRELNTTTGDYNGQNTTSLQNAVYIRLTTPLGSWWANPALGSLLHTLPREKDVERVGLLAQQYAEEALQPLLDDKRVKTLLVTYQQPKNGWLLLFIEVTDNRGEHYQFQHPVKVI